jgi:hypothetical protein
MSIVVSATALDDWQAGQHTTKGRYPTLQALLGGMCADGHIKPGEYRIVMTDEDRARNRARWAANLSR